MKSLKKLSFLIIFLCVVFLLNSIVFTDYYNSNVLFGSYTKKMARATSIDENKFIIVGGSASNFGFDAKKFEELSGKTAVNLSISADVPLRVYMKATEKIAKPGDVVFLILEYKYYQTSFNKIDETYIDLVNIDADLKCKDGFWGNIDFAFTSFLRAFTKVNDCFMFAFKKALKTENTIYIADSVDEYGDFCLHEGRESVYHRVQVKSEFKYKISVLEEIKSFIEKMNSNGVSVCISYPPLDGQTLKNSDEYFTEVHNVLIENIGFQYIIGTPATFFYDEDFFFDSEYHIRYENREKYTQMFYDAYCYHTKSFS